MRTGIDIPFGVDQEETFARTAVAPHAAVVVQAAIEVAEVLAQVRFPQLNILIEHAVDEPFQPVKVLAGGDRDIVPRAPGMADHVDRVDLDALDRQIGEKVHQLLGHPNIYAVQNHNDAEVDGVFLQNADAAYCALMRRSAS